MDTYQAELRVRLQARIAELEAAMKGLATDFPKSAAELRRVSQQLRRAGGKYGFPEVTEAAGATELAEEARLLETASRLLQVLETLGEPGDGDQRVLLIVEDDPSLARQLETASRRLTAAFSRQAAWRTRPSCWRHTTWRWSCSTCSCLTRTGGTCSPGSGNSNAATRPRSS